MRYFWTADTHFNHKNILKYCNRPFSSIQEMDEEIIKRWNSKVEKSDIVFHLGDFAFGNSNDIFDKYFNQLNGKIIWIKGNHDSLAYKNKEKFYKYCLGYYETKIDGQLIVMCHYAMLTWNQSHYGSFHLYGHSHGNLSDNPNLLSMDVGVDTNNYYPYSFKEIKKNMELKTPVARIDNIYSF
jgi:calcineurin-like phosphoesterase family protein